MTFETFLLILLGLDLIATFCFWAENRRLKEENETLKSKLSQEYKELYYKHLEEDKIICSKCNRPSCFYCILHMKKD